MNINSVSFGQRQPLIMCYAKNEDNGTFIPVTFCELDPKDSKDIEDIDNLNNDDLYYKSLIASDMYKHNDINYLLGSNSERFFIIEDPNGSVLGITETSRNGQNVNIDYISSSRKSPYKYIGQDMIASLCVDILKTDNIKKLLVPLPVKSAKNFYTKVCGFKYDWQGVLAMNRKQMQKFINSVEEKTQKPIINLSI